MYNLKYGGLGARVLCKPSPMTQLTANLRRLGDVYGISSMAVLDFQRYKLMRWDVGVNFFASNMSYQINLNTDKLVQSTRYEIWPTLVVLSEANRVFKDSSFMSNLSLGFEWEVQPRTAFQLNFSQHSSPTFGFQYHCSSIQCLVKVYGDIFYNRSSIYGDVFDKRIGVSLSFHPSSLLP